MIVGVDGGGLDGRFGVAVISGGYGKLRMLASLFYNYRLTRNLFPWRGHLYALRCAVVHTRLQRRHSGLHGETVQ